MRYDLRYINGALVVYDHQRGRVVYRIRPGDTRFARELVHNLNQGKRRQEYGGARVAA